MVRASFAATFILAAGEMRAAQQISDFSFLLPPPSLSRSFSLLLSLTLYRSRLSFRVRAFAFFAIGRVRRNKLFFYWHRAAPILAKKVSSPFTGRAASP